jgi:periplasmic divalent cation tolerance protein
MARLGRGSRDPSTSLGGRGIPQISPVAWYSASPSPARYPRVYGRTIRAMTGADSAGAEFVQAQTTTDSRAEGMDLARAAVEARLAACAQVTGPLASTYWWDEDVERAEEWLVCLKLPADRFDELAAFLTERHSYDEPEIVATPIVAGSAAYLSWVREETRPRHDNAS